MNFSQKQILLKVKNTIKEKYPRTDIYLYGSRADNSYGLVFWGLYKDLKIYKIDQTLFDKQTLRNRFDAIVEPIKEGFAHLNPILKNLADKKNELLCNRLIKIE